MGAEALRIALIVGAALAAAPAGVAKPPARIYDAPSVEEARRSIQAEIALAKNHSVRRKPLPILNATTTTTPEIEHVETGARCRFWYRSADIGFPWLDDRALECGTSYDWVTAGLGLYSVEGPSRPIQHGGKRFLAGVRSLAEAARALAEDRARSSQGARILALSAPATLRTAGGRTVEYVDYAILGPGGGPKGTRQTHYQSVRVALIDGWVIEAGAYGAGHYRRSLDAYVRSNFAHAIAAMEGAGRLPFFRTR